MGRVARLRDDFMDFYVKKHGFSIKAWLGPKRLNKCITTYFDVFGA